MTKINNILKITFSSKYLWVFLILSYFFFGFLNFLLVKYFYNLMIINPKYLFFWYPENYSFQSRGVLYGPQIITRVVFFIFLIFLLYISGPKESFKKYLKIKATFFIVTYFIISAPSRGGFPDFVEMLINMSAYSPIESYMKDTKRNYREEYVETPMGTYKMFKKANYPNDRLYNFQLRCMKQVKDCYDYPYHYKKIE